MKMSVKRTSWSLVSAIALVACGGVAEEDDVSSSGDELDETGTLSQALNSSCGEEPSQFDFPGQITPDLVTSAYSGGCHDNSIMVDIDSYSEAYLTPTLTPATVPTTQALCENTRLGYYVWERTSPTNTYLGSSWAYGSWGGSLVGCIVYMNSPVALSGSDNYRFGITVRQYNVPVTLRFRSVIDPS